MAKILFSKMRLETLGQSPSKSQAMSRYSGWENYQPTVKPKRSKSNIPQISEKTFQAQVRQMAEIFHWKCYATWRSIHSPAGFPDLVLLRGNRLVIAELKREGKNPTPAQANWLGLFSAVPGLEVFCWRPSDIAAIERVLR